jgi:hypothetical protein
MILDLDFLIDDDEPCGTPRGVGVICNIPEAGSDFLLVPRGEAFKTDFFRDEVPPFLCCFSEARLPTGSSPGFERNGYWLLLAGSTTTWEPLFRLSAKPFLRICGDLKLAG